MRTFKLTTAQGLEICVDCDELFEDVRGDSLMAKRNGLPVHVFPRTSVLCWEEVVPTAAPAPRSKKPPRSVFHKRSRDRDLTA